MIGTAHRYESDDVITLVKICFLLIYDLCLRTTLQKHIHELTLQLAGRIAYNGIVLKHKCLLQKGVYSNSITRT